MALAFLAISNHLSSWNWKWLRKAKKGPWASLKLFPQWRESLCQSPWEQEGGLSLAYCLLRSRLPHSASHLGSAVGQTLQVEQRQHWCCHSQSRPLGKDQGGCGQFYSMTVSSLQLPSGPRVTAVTQVRGGKESSRPYGGALKNAAPDLGSADVTGSVHLILTVKV